MFDVLRYSCTFTLTDVTIRAYISRSARARVATRVIGARGTKQTRSIGWIVGTFVYVCENKDIELVHVALEKLLTSQSYISPVHKQP